LSQEAMSRERLGCWSLSLVIVISLLVGALGGGLAGGAIVALSPSLLAISSPVTLPQLAPLAIQTVVVPAGQVQVLSEESAIVQATSKVGPAVVTVINTLPPQRSLFGTSSQPEARGTGVLLDPNGYIVTNNHVVEGNQSLSVLLANGDKRGARLVGTDTFSDLAVLKIEGSGFPIASLGDSSSLQPGQMVVAIGSALGDFRNTVTMGVVSALGRSLETDKGFNQEDLIQTDAAINRGNSGGPLINLEGQVVGINTMIAGRSTNTAVVAEGLGFAIPASTVRQVVDQIIRSGKVARPYLGVSWQAVTASVASYYDLPVKAGALVTGVSPNTPASQAGLKTGDIIVRIDDQGVDADTPFVNALMRHKVGDSVKLVVNRGGKELTLDAVLSQNQQ
jgi:S1-C subfamily serine protease